MSTNEFQEIPKVELVNFSFSPPGPMGWSSAEYETMLEDPETFLSQNKYRKAEPPTGDFELIELPIKTRKPQEAEVPAASIESMEEVALDAAAIETVHSDEKEKKKAKKKQTAESITEILETVPAAEELPVPSVEELPMPLETAPPMEAEEVQPARKRTLSLNDMLSLYQGSSSSESENQQQQQETQVRTKRKSKSRNTTRKNRVLFM